MKVAIIASTARHKSHTTTVEDMYSVSPLFRHSVAYCAGRYSKIFVLSVEHGLLTLDETIKPNNSGLDQVQRQDFRSWLEQTARQIQKTISKDSELYFFAGNRFRKLIPYLDGYKCHEPLKGMGIGKQLNFLITNQNKKGGE